jgi:heterotetrameric sarcosine oxidase gamma subunit
VPEFTLTAAPPLAGLDKSFGPNKLRAPEGLAVVALAIPMDGEEAAADALRRAYGVEMPAPGASALGMDGATRLLRSAPDQLLALFTHATPDAEQRIASDLGDAVYLTDQTDALAALELEGPQARAALARICPLDLHPDSFAQGAGARTMMEHLAVTILRTGDARFLLLSASSSAESFRHAVEQSLHNVL